MTMAALHCRSLFGCAYSCGIGLTSAAAISRHLGIASESTTCIFDSFDSVSTVTLQKQMHNVKTKLKNTHVLTTAVFVNTILTTTDTSADVGHRYT